MVVDHRPHTIFRYRKHPHPHSKKQEFRCQDANNRICPGKSFHINSNFLAKALSGRWSNKLFFRLAKMIN